VAWSSGTRLRLLQWWRKEEGPGRCGATWQEDGGVRQARCGRERWGPAQHLVAAVGRQRPGHAGHGQAGVAAQNRGGGALTCGPHGTVPVG
jgi:hypothetical protein